MHKITTRIELDILMNEKVFDKCVHDFKDKNNPDNGPVGPWHTCNVLCVKCGAKPDGYNHNMDYHPSTDWSDTMQALSYWKIAGEGRDWRMGTSSEIETEHYACLYLGYHQNNADISIYNEDCQIAVGIALLNAVDYKCEWGGE